MISGSSIPDLLGNAFFLFIIHNLLETKNFQAFTIFQMRHDAWPIRKGNFNATSLAPMQELKLIDERVWVADASPTSYRESQRITIARHGYCGESSGRWSSSCCTWRLRVAGFQQTFFYQRNDLRASSQNGIINQRNRSKVFLHSSSIWAHGHCLLNLLLIGQTYRGDTLH